MAFLDVRLKKICFTWSNIYCTIILVPVSFCTPHSSFTRFHNFDMWSRHFIINTTDCRQKSKVGWRSICLSGWYRGHLVRNNAQWVRLHTNTSPVFMPDGTSHWFQPKSENNNNQSQSPGRSCSVAVRMEKVKATNDYNPFPWSPSCTFLSRECFLPVSFILNRSSLKSRGECIKKVFTWRKVTSSSLVFFCLVRATTETRR